MTDNKIDTLFRNAKIEASADFGDRTFASIVKTQQLQHSLDFKCNELLRASKISASSTFTERVANSILKQRRSTPFEKISKILALVATAACLTITFAQLSVPNRYTISEYDFAEMSNLDSEITSLANLIYEQELIDILLK